MCAFGVTFPCLRRVRASVCSCNCVCGAFTRTRRFAAFQTNSGPFSFNRKRVLCPRLLASFCSWPYALMAIMTKLLNSPQPPAPRNTWISESSRWTNYSGRIDHFSEEPRPRGIYVYLAHTQRHCSRRPRS